MNHFSSVPNRETIPQSQLRNRKLCFLSPFYKTKLHLLSLCIGGIYRVKICMFPKELFPRVFKKTVKKRESAD